LEGGYLFLKKLVVGNYGENCYIAGSTRNADGIVIDPGDQGGDILREIDNAGLKIKTVVITHGHFDHVGAVRQVAEATGAQVVIHTDDSWAMKRFSLTTLMTRSMPPEGVRLLVDGDMITCGELEFQVLHTPGHTPGGICLQGCGIAFTGDTLFRSSIGRSDFPRGSHRDLINSIRTRLMILPDDTVCYPGHGPETTIGYERRNNPFLR
jgi:hydroxyacylglutathione hydrolase